VARRGQIDMLWFQSKTWEQAMLDRWQKFLDDEARAGKPITHSEVLEWRGEEPKG